MSGRLFRHDITGRCGRTTGLELARQLRNDVPSPRRRGLAESLGEQNVDLGFGWPNGDEWSRTYVNSGWVFFTRADVFLLDFRYLAPAHN